MHEASIAQSIVRTVLKNAQAQNAKSVQSVELEVGQLTFLNIEQVTFWVQNGFENTVADQAELRIHKIPARFRCLLCDFEGLVEMHDHPAAHFQAPLIACAQCDGHKIEVFEGKDVIVRNIRIVKSNHEED